MTETDRLDVPVNRRDCYREDGSPIMCWKCGSHEQREVVRDMVGSLGGQGPVCEVEVFCAECGEGIAYWAYGSYDPGYMHEDETRLGMEKLESKK